MQQQYAFVHHCVLEALAPTSPRELDSALSSLASLRMDTSTAAFPASSNSAPDLDPPNITLLAADGMDTSASTAFPFPTPSLS